MVLFSHKKETAPLFPPEQYEPVIRRSICTGEQTGCVRERDSGRLREVMLIRTEEDLREFRRLVQAGDAEIPTIY